MFRSQEGWNKVIWLVIVLKSIVEFAMEMWLLSKSSGQFLEIHLTFDQTQFNSTCISHVTKYCYKENTKDLELSPVSSEFVLDKSLYFFSWKGCSIDSHKVWCSSHKSLVKGQYAKSWCGLNTGFISEGFKMTYQSIVSSFLGVQSIRWSLNLRLTNSSCGTDTNSVWDAGDSGRSHSKNTVISTFETTISLFAGKVEREYSKMLRTVIVKAGIWPIQVVYWFLEGSTVPPHGERLLSMAGLFDILVHEPTMEIGTDCIVDKVLFLFWFLKKFFFYFSCVIIIQTCLSCTIFENNIIIPSSFDASVLFLVIL